MKTIQILGTGCPKCLKLAANADAAAKRLGIPYQLVKVTDITAITAAGVMMTPALIVDGTVKVVGKVPSVDDLAKLLA